jgi:hypothetical protein
MMTADELAEKAIALRRKYKPLIEKAQANWRRARILAEELTGLVRGHSYDGRELHDKTGFSDYEPFTRKYRRDLESEIRTLILEFIGEAP